MGWRRWIGRSRKDKDRAREIAVHIAEATDYYVRQGIDREEAARLARIRFGNRRAVQERVHDMNRFPVMDILGRDLRFAVRRMRKAPGFSASVILTLAVVIGATSAVFSLADAILLRPLPLPNPDRLAIVGVHRVSPRGEYTGTGIDGGMFKAAHEQATLIDTAVTDGGTSGVNVVLNGAPSFVQAQSVGAGYLRVLGVTPVIGREFSAAEAAPGGPAVVILSKAFWQKVFQSSSNAIGQTILLRGEPHTVVGVVAGGIRDLVDADVWTPLRNPGGGLNYMAIARLKDTASFEAANAELLALGDAPFTMEEPVPDVTQNLVLESLHDTLAKGAREPIAMLGWAVAAVLLIACVNIAALLLARGSGRAKEIATRMALGSGRTAVIRQLMIESAVLALCGGALGVLVAWIGLDSLKTLGGPTFSEWRDATLNGRVVVAALGLGALTSVLFGLLPAWQTSRIDVQRSLASGGSRSIAGGSRNLSRRLLVVAEVALGVVLLVAAGLLLRQFASLRSLDPGFSPDHLYTVSASLQDARYQDPVAVNRLFTSSLEQLKQTPGIDAATVTQRLPYERLLNNAFDIEGRPRDPQHPPIANIAYVTPSFFDTFGIPVKQGRALDDRDRAGMPGVVVVNQMFADIYFKGEPVIGRRLIFGRDNALEIVGVAGNVQQFGTGFFVTGMHRGPILTSPTIYQPAEQTGAGLFRWFSPTWTVRASSPAVAAEALSQSIHAADPLLPINEMRSMTGVVSASLAAPRLMMTLVGALAIAALLLAAIGIHGLITHIVSDRTREFGIRLALGASSRQIMGSVALSGIAFALIGALVGLGLSVPATRLVEASLTELTTKDAATYVGVTVLLFVVAALSSVLPALRVSRLNPAQTLRD